MSLSFFSHWRSSARSHRDETVDRDADALILEWGEAAFDGRPISPGRRISGSSCPPPPATGGASARKWASDSTGTSRPPGRRAPPDRPGAMPHRTPNSPGGRSTASGTIDPGGRFGARAEPGDHLNAQVHHGCRSGSRHHLLRRCSAGASPCSARRRRRGLSPRSRWCPGAAASTGIADLRRLSPERRSASTAGPAFTVGLGSSAARFPPRFRLPPRPRLPRGLWLPRGRGFHGGHGFHRGHGHFH